MITAVAVSAEVILSDGAFTLKISRGDAVKDQFQILGITYQFFSDNRLYESVGLDFAPYGVVRQSDLTLFDLPSVCYPETSQ